MRDRSGALSARWEKHGFDLRLGLGLSQGYATLGAIGSDTRAEYAAVGIVTALAARLCEEARPGEILASQRLLAAVDELVESEPAGERALRGFPRPVPVFRVLGPKAAAVPAEAASPATPGTFRQEGEYWTIVYEGRSFRLRDSKGLRYIAHLLRHPERDFHALDLVALVRADGEEPPAARVDTGEVPAGGLGDAGAVLDARARAAYQERLAELRDDLAEAEALGDAGRASSRRSEIDFLTQQLAAAVGLGGRDRRVAAAAERARVNVTRAISDGIRRIRAFSQPLARHLDASIRTGTFCTYQPPEPRRAEWRL